MASTGLSFGTLRINSITLQMNVLGGHLKAFASLMAVEEYAAPFSHWAFTLITQGMLSAKH